MSERQKFLSLLNSENELKKKNQCLENEDPESFRIFLNFLVKIETNFHYLSKQKYINLANDFLDNKIIADDFCYCFIALYSETSEKLNEMKKTKNPELANFIEPNRPKLGTLMARIYSACDSFSPDVKITMSTEQELKNYAQILLVELQKK